MNEVPKKSRRGRPKTLKKADVTDVAMHAYWENGPAEVSLNAICQQAGVSKPSVYREFGNDDGLTHAALSSYADKVLGKMLTITQSEDSFARKLNQLVHLSAEDVLHEHGCLFVKMRTAKAQMGPKTQELIGAIESMSLDAFSKVLSEARAAGSGSGGISVELGARYLQAQIGLALDQRARGEDPKETLALALSVFNTADT
ncbi:MAG: TetR/AcrR family transcriptional regulator [Rhodobacteraceae bacterium]|nr:TetR/AcrR family transcriptional regulator [Paracoccaceae bacterium]